MGRDWGAAAWDILMTVIFGSTPEIIHSVQWYAQAGDAERSGFWWGVGAGILGPFASFFAYVEGTKAAGGTPTSEGASHSIFWGSIIAMVVSGAVVGAIDGAAVSAGASAGARAAPKPVVLRGPEPPTPAARIATPGAPTKNLTPSWTGQGRLRPETRLAEGPHVTFKVDAKGRVAHYAEWTPNPRNPSGWDMVKKVDMRGDPHFNKIQQEWIPTPHAQGRSIPGGVRPLEPWEVPKGWS